MSSGESVKTSRVILEFESSNIGIKKAIETGAKMSGILMELTSPPEEINTEQHEWVVEIARGEVRNLQIAVEKANKIMQGVRIRVIEVIRPSCLPDVDLEF
ncbi:hypothetical protein KJ742_00150 [Patescibacteria group bacterium]|nr:hypothetical protein [Patescibacteria group bacterium]MBU1682335.1 hypothetical protein [Patescibacteria group bacterium]